MDVAAPPEITKADAAPWDKSVARDRTDRADLLFLTVGVTFCSGTSSSHADNNLRDHDMSWAIRTLPGVDAPGDLADG
jgi:hypothetical protein